MCDMSFVHCFSKPLDLVLSFAYSMAIQVTVCGMFVGLNKWITYVKVHMQHKSVPITKGNIPIHSRQAMLSFSGYSFEEQWRFITHYVPVSMQLVLSTNSHVSQVRCTNLSSQMAQSKECLFVRYSYSFWYTYVYVCARLTLANDYCSDTFGELRTNERTVGWMCLRILATMPDIFAEGIMQQSAYLHVRTVQQMP